MWVTVVHTGCLPHLQVWGLNLFYRVLQSQKISGGEANAGRKERRMAKPGGLRALALLPELVTYLFSPFPHLAYTPLASLVWTVML